MSMASTPIPGLAESHLLRLLKTHEELGLSSAGVAVFMSLIAGCSTALGASCIYFFKPGPIDPNIMSFTLSLAAGVMLTVSASELMPRIFAAPEELSSVIGVLWALCGAGMYLVISYSIPHCSPELPQFCNQSGEVVGELRPIKQKDEREPEIISEQNPMSRVRAWRLAMVLMLSLSAHNFPEGLAVAVSAMSSVKLGYVVMIAIMVHNIPEGIAIAVPAYAAHGSKWKAMILATASGFSEPMGAVVAVLFMKDFSAIHLRYALSFVAGMMCTVAIVELIPEAWKQSRKPQGFWAGLLCGALVMLTTERLIG
eukprot:GEMP01020985.1.p1 GENE.GEMP01020985.1~~GEMP01020985.1.p1  ORF type:complete len:312 (+),score=31.38 GEMP01020985.1:137-1072(+)